jgi:hypothetical protein
MEKNEFVDSFFSQISQLKELLSVGTQIEEDDFVYMTIDRLPDSWTTFISFVYGRGEPPSFKRFWHDPLEDERKLQQRF